MNISFPKLKRLLVLIMFFATSISSFGQSEINKWKVQIAFGINYPDVDGFVKGFEAKPFNFPTINLGVQNMFAKNLGVKMDLGYNRFSNAESSAKFKTNYTRLNAQLVYDVTNDLRFLPSGIGLVGHFGPGLSFIKPLGNYSNNKHSFFNGLGGLELHYRIAKTVSAYADVSYIMNLSGDKTYDPISEGYGTFNNNLFNFTFGISVSLSGCVYCD
ncbi:MAG: outer membrane beta-barrel protein [Flavobacteriaceae bacterium]|nr:outer membrane beta-barrel protein [Bacteroidia bacterium]NNL15207.1 outer membrane beta-barrel protein [Flavobacteriaceae bacterium]